MFWVIAGILAIIMILVTIFFLGCFKLGSNADKAMEKYMRDEELNQYGERD